MAERAMWKQCISALKLEQKGRKTVRVVYTLDEVMLLEWLQMQLERLQTLVTQPPLVPLGEHSRPGWFLERRHTCRHLQMVVPMWYFIKCLLEIQITSTGLPWYQQRQLHIPKILVNLRLSSSTAIGNAYFYLVTVIWINYNQLDSTGHNKRFISYKSKFCSYNTVIL